LANLKIYDEETESWIMVRTGAVSNAEDTVYLDIDDFVKMVDDMDRFSSSLSSLQTQSDSTQTNLANHVASKDNPHSTTKDQVGLSNVDNVKQASKTEFDAHVNDTANPHAVTKSQVGLANVDNAKQATKAEFDTHVANTDIHWTKAQRDELLAKLVNIEERLALLEQPESTEQTTPPPTTEDL